MAEPADQTNDLLKELVKLTTGLVETQKRALNERSSVTARR